MAFMSYDTKLYKSHSFRIGAATHATIQGHSEEEIRNPCLSKSSALQYYVRIPKINVDCQVHLI